MSTKITDTAADESVAGFWQVVVYLLTYGARGFYQPFISLYLISAGFSPVDVGLLIGASALFRLIVVPAYSTYVDRIGAHRKLLNVQLGISGLASIAMVFFPHRLWMSGMFVARDSVDIPAAALMGQLSISGFKERGSQRYGRLRAMGSLGWAIACFISGTISAIAGYPGLIVISGIAYLISVPMTGAFPERTAATNSRIDKPPKRLPAFWIIMASNQLFYIGTNAMSLFLFVYVKEYLGADDYTVGVFAACLGLFEVPWMIAINRIYRYVDTRTALWIGLLGQAVFTVALALMTNLDFLIPLVIFRGLFYAMQNISLTLMITEISHPANVATNQAITWVTIPALAYIITGPIAGWTYENIGPQVLFVVAGFIIISSALILTIGGAYIQRARQSRLPLHVN